MKQPKTLQVGVKSLLMNSKGEILLLKKNPAHFKGATAYWDIPGGRIETGSDLYTNLKREIKEETGISRVTPLKLLAAQDIDRPTFHVIRLTYLSRVTSDKVMVNSSEHTAHKWVTVEELLKISNKDPFLKAILKDKGLVSFIKDTRGGNHR